MLYLEDYERVSGKVHEKSLCIDMEAQSPGYRGKGQTSKCTQKEVCNEQVFIKRNINEGRRTSTPNRKKGFRECYIDLSPISDGVLSRLINDRDCNK